jgi:hypothetical protein
MAQAPEIRQDKKVQTDAKPVVVPQPSYRDVLPDTKETNRVAALPALASAQPVPEAIAAAKAAKTISESTPTMPAGSSEMSPANQATSVGRTGTTPLQWRTDFSESEGR